MHTKTFLIYLSLLIFQSCNISTSNFKKDQSIDAATRQEIKVLNDKLFKAITTNDLTALQSLMAPGLFDKFESDIKTTLLRYSDFKIDSYDILDEFSVHNSNSGNNSITLLSGNSNDNDYIVHFESANVDNYVSLLLLNNGDSKFLVTVIYGRYDGQWKINILKLGQYWIYGKTAPDYYKLARASYKKSYLIDAIDYISLANLCIRPTGDYFQFNQEKEIKEFEDTLMKEVNAKFQFPMTLENIESKPQLFRIYPELREEGFFPMIDYISTIDLKDTIALKIENQKIQQEVHSLFKGIDEDKKYVFYSAFGEMPDGQKKVSGYGFTDTLKNR